MNPIPFARPARLALCATLLALPFAPCPAQEPPPAAKTAGPPVSAEAGLISIDFPGGPMSKLVAKLNESGDDRLSIVQSKGLDPVLPAFSVRNVHAHEIIAALGRILEPQGYALNPMGLNLAVLHEAPWTKAPQSFISLQLESKLGDGKVEDIIAAIQMGCEFANEGKPSTLRFKYHPGTKLLFVAGTAQEVGVAERVYQSLPGYPPKGTAQPAPPEKK